jgi:hypothetical protein
MVWVWCVCFTLVGAEVYWGESTFASCTERSWIFFEASLSCLIILVSIWNESSLNDLLLHRCWCCIFNFSSLKNAAAVMSDVEREIDLSASF